MTTAIIIPTLNEEQGKKTGNKALLTAGQNARLIVSVDRGPNGFTRTVNEGLTQVKKGEDVCILNDDITGFPYGWLTNLRHALYSNSRFGVAVPSGKSSTRPMKEGTPWMHGIEKVNQAPFWCALIKAKAFSDLGLLDQRLIHYGSDNEYCHRARAKGWRIIWVKHVFLKHEHHGSGMKKKWRDHDIPIMKKLGLIK